MLKSLHHVPLPLMAKALAETARVLRTVVRDGRRYAKEIELDD